MSEAGKTAGGASRLIVGFVVETKMHRVKLPGRASWYAISLAGSPK